MNDYKELVETLRNGTKSPLHVTPNGFMAFDVSAVNTIADIIEQYVNDYEILAKMYAKVSEELCARTKERDAAVADLRKYCDCIFCKWFIDGDCTDLKHEKCYGEHWEWGGVQNETD